MISVDHLADVMSVQMVIEIYSGSVLLDVNSDSSKFLHLPLIVITITTAMTIIIMMKMTKFLINVMIAAQNVLHVLKQIDAHHVNQLILISWTVSAFHHALLIAM